MHTNPYLVVAGSARPLRRSPAVADWVARLGAEVSATPFHVVDLCEVGLGFDDEPALPAKGVYVCATTRRWSERVAGAQGVVFVTPQYNLGYPAILKNAIDHLHGEWRDKPVLVITYGGGGGDKCAAQLRQVLTGVHVRLTEAMPGLLLARERIVADDGEIDPEQDFADHREAVRTAIGELVALSEPVRGPA